MISYQHPHPAVNPVGWALPTLMKINDGNDLVYTSSSAWLTNLNRFFSYTLADAGMMREFLLVKFTWSLVHGLARLRSKRKHE